MKQDTKTIINTDNDPGLHRKPYEQKITKSLSFSIPKFHWVKDKVDTRDHPYQLTGATQSSIVDLRQYCSLIEDQGNLGSCTGNAIAGAIELINKRNNKLLDINSFYSFTGLV